MPVSSRPPAKGSFVLQCIALKKDLSQKDIGPRIEKDHKEVSRQLRKEVFDDRPRLRQGRGAEDLLAELGDTCHAHRAWQRFLRLRLPDPPPVAEDREPAREQLALLKDLPENQRMAVVRVAWDFQTWALAEQAAQASAAADDLREAGAWARLAVEIARTIRGSDAWRNRVQGFALAQEARVLEASGDRTAAAVSEEARKLWNSGEDPAGLLEMADVGRGGRDHLGRRQDLPAAG